MLDVNKKEGGAGRRIEKAEKYEVAQKYVMA